MESLFLGQAGFFNSEKDDEYYMSLKLEYQFLKQKFDLNTVNEHSVKFSKLRPSNFPTIRLAQFSRLFEKQNRWLSFCVENDVEQIKNGIHPELGLQEDYTTHTDDWVFKHMVRMRNKRLKKYNKVINI